MCGLVHGTLLFFSYNLWMETHTLLLCSFEVMNCVTLLLSDATYLYISSCGICSELLLYYFEMLTGLLFSDITYISQLVLFVVRCLLFYYSDEVLTGLLLC